MARSQRSADAALSLLAALETAPGEFDFYQALRLLEAAYPDRPRLGRSKRPADDAVRLGQSPELSFAPRSWARAQFLRRSAAIGRLVFRSVRSERTAAAAHDRVRARPPA